MPRDNRCMYMVHVCLSVVVTVWGSVGMLLCASCGSSQCCVSFCLPHPVAVSAFMICRGLCACTEMLWMCVLYVSFGSKVRPRSFGCVAMGSTLLYIFRSRLLVYSAGSGMNRVPVVLSR